MKIGERKLVQSFGLFLSPLLYHNLNGFDGQKVLDVLILILKVDALPFVVGAIIITIHNRHLLDVNSSVKGGTLIGRIKHDGKGVLDCA